MNATGSFFVRSAYHVARALVYSEGASASASAMLLDDRWCKLLRKLLNAYVPGEG